MSKRQSNRIKKKTPLMSAGTSREHGDENSDSISTPKQLLSIKNQIKIGVHKTLKRKVNKNSPRQRKRLTIPTLADLEKMYEDSETNESATDTESDTRYINTSPSTSSNIQVENKISSKENISHAKTNLPNQNEIENSREIYSVTKPITQNIYDVIVIDDKPEDLSTNGDGVIIIESLKGQQTPSAAQSGSGDDVIIIGSLKGQQTPSVPRRRSGDAVIIIGSPSVSRRVSSDGVNLITDLDREQLQKLRKLSESSDKNHLVNHDHAESDDSDVTVVYDVEETPTKSPSRSFSPSRRFSPLPSTSTDSATIRENDKFFVESLSSASEHKYDLRSAGKETVHIIEAFAENSQSQSSDNINDLTLPSNDSNEIADEVIDLVILENESILTKYKSDENLHSVTHVIPKQTINTYNVGVNSAALSKFSPIVPTTITLQRKQSIASPALHDLVILENESILTKYKSDENLHSVTHVKPKQTTNTYNVGVNSAALSKFSPIVPTTTTLQRKQSIASPALNCPICFENLISKECASTICGHIFCMTCIKKSLKYARKCPTCRKTVKGTGYHKLFL